MINTTSRIWLLTHMLITAVGYIFFNLELDNKYLGQELVTAIGASLVAAGVTGIALYLYISRNESLKEQISSTNKAGLTRVFSGRSTSIREEYESRIETAKNIDIIGFGLSQFREDYLQNFENWSESKVIRILLLHPDFPNEEFSFADIRNKEESNPEGKIKSEIEKFVSSCQSKNINQNNFQIRLMKAIPSVNIFRMDDELFWGPYLMGAQSRNTTTMIVRKGGFLFDQLSDHFEIIWTDNELSCSIQCE